MKISFTFAWKQAALMRRSAVLSPSLQYAFPGTMFSPERAALNSEEKSVLMLRNDNNMWRPFQWRPLEYNKYINNWSWQALNIRCGPKRKKMFRKGSSLPHTRVSLLLMRPNWVLSPKTLKTFKSIWVSNSEQYCYFLRSLGSQLE